MIRKITCSNGMVYAVSDNYDASVDEVIAFLEQFRGMRFWNGASGDVAFRLDNGCICCDSASYHAQSAYEVDEELGEIVDDFFYNSEVECITEEEWRTEHPDNY